MPEFTYKAADINGTILRGRYEAQDRKTVFGMIRDKGLFPLTIDEVNQGGNINRFISVNRLNSKYVAVFCRQLAAVMKAGVSISLCLDVLYTQEENKSLRDTMGKLKEEVMKGKSLFEAMRIQQGIFPDLLINMVQGGELSGTLDASLERMAEHFEREYMLKQRIRGALIYPTIISAVAVVVVYILLKQVVPQFVSFFVSNDISLPLLTKILVRVGDALPNLFLMLLIVVILCIMTLITLRHRGRFVIHRFFLRLPIIGALVRIYIGARFSRTLSTLIATGIPLTQALEITGRVINNGVVEKAIEEAEEQVRRGKSLHDALKNLGCFPSMVVQMTSIGEETGKLDEMLRKTAEYCEYEAELRVQKMLTMLEPLIIIVLGCIVGFIVLSVAVPMFEMLNIVGY